MRISSDGFIEERSHIVRLSLRNIRRCVNTTGRLVPSNSTSPSSDYRNSPSIPTGVLSSCARPSQQPPPPPTVVHHRGAYYTILRPSCRRTDVCVFRDPRFSDIACHLLCVIQCSAWLRSYDLSCNFHRRRNVSKISTKRLTMRCTALLLGAPLHRS